MTLLTECLVFHYPKVQKNSAINSKERGFSNMFLDSFTGSLENKHEGLELMQKVVGEG